MAKTTKNRGGRPKVDAVPVTVRVHPPEAKALDAFISKQPDPKPSRPDIIRLALREWLARKVSQGC